DFVARALQLLTTLDVGPPAIVHCTLLGAQGATLAVDQAFSLWHVNSPFRQDLMRLPDVSVSDYGAEPTTVVKPILDALWQAAGFPRSFEYDDAGKWVPRR